jgi:hypothetical protein
VVQPFPLETEPQRNFPCFGENAPKPQRGVGNVFIDGFHLHILLPLLSPMLGGLGFPNPPPGDLGRSLEGLGSLGEVGHVGGDFGKPVNE